jgi:hypothetical protein
MGLSASNYTEDENIFLYPYRNKIVIHRLFPKSWTDFKCLYNRIYLIWHPQNWRGAAVFTIPFNKQCLY